MPLLDPHTMSVSCDDACDLVLKLRRCRYDNFALWRDHFNLLVLCLRTHGEKFRLTRCYFELVDMQDLGLRKHLRRLMDQHAVHPAEEIAPYDEASLKRLGWGDNAFGLMFRLIVAKWDFLARCKRLDADANEPSLSLQERIDRDREHDDWTDVVNFWTALLRPHWSLHIEDLLNDDTVPTITVVSSPCPESRPPSRQGTEPIEDETHLSHHHALLDVESDRAAERGPLALHQGFSPARPDQLLAPSPYLNGHPTTAFLPARPLPPSPGHKHKYGYAAFPSADCAIQDPALERIVIPAAPSFTSPIMPSISRHKRGRDNVESLGLGLPPIKKTRR